MKPYTVILLQPAWVTRTPGLTASVVEHVKAHTPLEAEDLAQEVALAKEVPDRCLTILGGANAAGDYRVLATFEGHLKNLTSKFRTE